MPRGVPKIGSGGDYTPKNPKLSSATEELLHTPEPELLGTIPVKNLDPTPRPTTWEHEDGTTVTFEEPPPPWEIDPKHVRQSNDARRFVKAPENVEFRWINPKLLDQVGWRDWQPVPARGDTKFKLLNKQLARPDNTVRRGGPDGDILAWMWRSWVISRRKLKRAEVDRRTSSAVERHAEVRERIRRGDFGPYIKDGGGSHPTHTVGDGRTMVD
jgi:hypothetical protein